MSRRLSRRHFLKTSSAATAWWVGMSDRSFAQSKSPNEKLNLAIVGVAGKGGDNVNNLVSENMVALCDVDRKNLGAAGERFPYAGNECGINDRGIHLLIEFEHQHACARRLAHVKNSLAARRAIVACDGRNGRFFAFVGVGYVASVSYQ